MKACALASVPARVLLCAVAANGIVHTDGDGALSWLRGENCSILVLTPWILTENPLLRKAGAI